MTNAVTREVIVDFYDLLSGQQIDGLNDALTEEAVLLFPKTQPLNGKEKIIRFFRLLFRQYPELKFQIQRTIIQGDSAAVHWTNRGFTRKKEAYENEGVTLMQFKEGKVSFLNDFFKNTEVF